MSQGIIPVSEDLRGAVVVDPLVAAAIGAVGVGQIHRPPVRLLDRGRAVVSANDSLRRSRQGGSRGIMYVTRTPRLPAMPTPTALRLGLYVTKRTLEAIGRSVIRLGVTR